MALEAHQSKCFHLGLGRKPIAKTTLATANQNRDYRIFEEFAFYMMALAREKRAQDIFKLGGKVYAFDSTTIPLCLSVFWWAKFRKKKGGVKAHFLYDLEAQVPAFYHITTASVYDSKTMSEIPYETGVYYVFARGYNSFGNFTAYSGWSPSSLSEQRQTCSTDVSSGSGGCQRTFSRMQRLN